MATFEVFADPVVVRVSGKKHAKTPIKVIRGVGIPSAGWKDVAGAGEGMDGRGESGGKGLGEDGTKVLGFGGRANTVSGGTPKTMGGSGRRKRVLGDVTNTPTGGGSGGGGWERVYKNPVRVQETRWEEGKEEEEMEAGGDGHDDGMDISASFVVMGAEEDDGFSEGSQSEEDMDEWMLKTGVDAAAAVHAANVRAAWVGALVPDTSTSSCYADAFSISHLPADDLPVDNLSAEIYTGTGGEDELYISDDDDVEATGVGAQMAMVKTAGGTTAYEEQFSQTMSMSEVMATPQIRRTLPMTPAESTHYKAIAAAHEATIASLRAEMEQTEKLCLAPISAVVSDLASQIAPRLEGVEGLDDEWVSGFDPDANDTESKALASLIRMVFTAGDMQSPSPSPSPVDAGVDMNDTLIDTFPGQMRLPSASPIPLRPEDNASMDLTMQLEGEAARGAANDDRVAELEAENRALRQQLKAMVSAVDELRAVPDPSVAIRENYAVLAEITKQETAIADVAIARAQTTSVETQTCGEETGSDVHELQARLGEALASSRSWAKLQLETAGNLWSVSNKYKALKIRYHKIRTMYSRAKATNAKHAEILANLSHRLEDHEASILEISHA